MSSIICDMNCDQETNKSVIKEHCFDCLCMGGLADVGHGHMPARKARHNCFSRPTAELLNWKVKLP